MRAASGALLVALLAGCPAFHAGAPPDAPAGSTFVDVDGVPVRYTDTGQGPAVVLVHGFGSSLDIWGPIVERLAPAHRVIAIDLKGFGWTGRPEGDYSPWAQARLVWKVLDARGVRDVAVVGHSWGASVALAMALVQPARVRRIALYSAYAFEDQVPSFFRWARTGTLGEILFALYYRERIEERVALAYHDPRHVTYERYQHVERELARPGAVAAALATARGQRYDRMEQRYRDIRVPVLLLWGDDDQVTTLAFGQRLAGEMPRARLIVYPACGHLPMVEAAGASTRDLVDFLAEPAP
ncbi:MAG TPA: alpha/beta fold hydrolase [Kofleriaceae bacterium]|nr:alpha/beta fold hydrolase [Kofleriaceae bacterium]